jgi:hypothetical protein
MWPNLLSLDAPLVAMVWQDFLARCYPAILRPAGRIALGLTVWAIYIADRLLDVRRPVAGLESLRHDFYRRHKRFWLVFLAALLMLDFLVALFWVRRAVLEYGLFVVPGILLYLLKFVLPGPNRTIWKKLMAGVFFTAGVFLIELPGTLRTAWPALAFFSLCLGNLLLVENWERGDRSRTGWLWMAGLCVVLIMPGLWAEGLWFRAIAISAAALSAIAYFEDSIPLNARSVLADAALLCPLLFR